MSESLGGSHDATGHKSLWQQQEVHRAVGRPRSSACSYSTSSRFRHDPLRLRPTVVSPTPFMTPCDPRDRNALGPELRREGAEPTSHEAVRRTDIRGDMASPSIRLPGDLNVIIQVEEWHSSDRLHGTVRAPRSAQIRALKCRWVSPGGPWGPTRYCGWAKTPHP